MLSLAPTERTVTWNGQEFPAVEFEGETLPEAYARVATCCLTSTGTSSGATLERRWTTARPITTRSRTKALSSEEL